MPTICTETYSCDKYEPIFATYPYPLSDFQKYAIEAIVEGHHVLSCAHTGSGKTLAAEFAIRHFVGQGKRVIYTSPIKALSNQKYYEFTRKYPDITFGLMTGDIKTNPCAQVLIMTTEILMNRLFTSASTSSQNILDQDSINIVDTIGENNSVGTCMDFQMNLDTELAGVVFDEVHYINDADRGHVWEETIMMLPQHVQMIMLSATIDNPVGFAEWCESCHPEYTKKVYLASTDKRIVPLTHYVYFATTEEPFKKIRDKEQQRIIRESTNKLLPILTPPPAVKFHDANYHKISQMSNLFQKERFFMKRKFVLNHLATHLRENEMLPAIVFVFSRKHVEQCAHEITTNLLEFDSKVAYTIRRECEQIVRKFPNFREYLELPEFNELVALLEKGIGIHHSGMIPVLREIVEIMISKKYVKMLFATESFAIGLDCPIRTAVFTSLQKFTTEGQRYLLAHEYTQMAGRAGRRGIDTVGHVIHLNNLFRDPPDIETYKTILGGKPQRLESKFHINYSMVLNLMRDNTDNSKPITVKKIMEYAENTMMARNIRASIESCEKYMKEKCEIYEKKKANIESLRGSLGFVEADICRKYMEWMENMNMYSNKKMKEIAREIAVLKDEYKLLLTYTEKYRELFELEKECQQELVYLEELKGSVENQIITICETLETKYGMIDSPNGDGEYYVITRLGNICSNMAEIHPLIAGKIIERTEFCVNWSVEDFVVFFSCFAQIKVDEEYRRLVVPDTVGKEMREHLRFIGEEIECIGEINTFTYDLVEEIVAWCACETEQQCKYFIQGVLKERGMGVGDFTKAVLKIATIAREWQSVCEMFGLLSVAETLCKVEGLILKYVTTCQSLYV